MEQRNKPIVKIVVACHKADPAIRQSEIYMPIQVGKALHPEINLGFQSDNTGNNISNKNGSYCELTALYWAWKNLRNVDYIGLAHYHRYYRGLPESPVEIAKILQKYDVITVRYKRHIATPFEVLSGLLTIEDATLMIDVLLSEYLSWKDEIIRYFLQRHSSSQCNMMIMSRELNDEYCSFLFSYLEKMEHILLPHSYTRLKRNIGYIAEVVMGAWLAVRKLRIKYYAMDICMPITTIGRIKGVANEIRYAIAAAMFRPAKDFIVADSIITGLKIDGIRLKALGGGKIV